MSIMMRTNKDEKNTNRHKRSTTNKNNDRKTSCVSSSAAGGRPPAAFLLLVSMTLGLLLKPASADASSLGMGLCGSTMIDRDTEGCCVVDTDGPTVVDLATEGCCIANGIQEILELSSHGCCLTGPNQQESILLADFGCCNTVSGGDFQEVVTIATTGCCGPDPGLQVTVDIGAGEICCDGVVEAGPTCSNPTARQGFNFGQSRFFQQFEEVPQGGLADSSASTWTPPEAGSSGAAGIQTIITLSAALVVMSALLGAAMAY